MTTSRNILFSALAFLAGIAADIGGSLVAGIALGIVFAVVLLAQGVPQAELVERLQEMALLPGIVVGFGFTMLGGYVAGRIAGQAERIHGGVNALLASVIGLLVLPSAEVPMWYRVVGWVGVVPFGILGGWIAQIERRRSVRRSVAEKPYDEDDFDDWTSRHPSDEPSDDISIRERRS